MDKNVTSTPTPARVDCDEGYIYTSRVVHLIDRTEPRLPGVPDERAPALCKVRPSWPAEWLAPTSETALPICKTCASVKEAIERV